MVKAVVYKENTLGYLLEPQGRGAYRNIYGYYNVYIWGGSYWKRGPTLSLNKKDLRPATREDFDRINVMFHPSYEINWNIDEV